MNDEGAPDPRARSAARRHLQRIGLICVFGLVFIVLSAVGDYFGLEGGSGRRSYSNEWGFVIGAICIGSGLFELARRLVVGPPKPGKRARY